MSEMAKTKPNISGLAGGPLRIGYMFRVQNSYNALVSLYVAETLRYLGLLNPDGPVITHQDSPTF